MIENLKVAGIPERSLSKSTETVAKEIKVAVIDGSISTFGEVVKLLHKDFKVPRNKIGKAIVLGAVSMVSNGYAEGEPIYKKYKELFCPWDGRAHRSIHCDKKCLGFKGGKLW